MLYDITIHDKLRKCSRSCNSGNDLSTKIYVPRKTKEKLVTLVKHISCDYKYKFNSTTCHSDQKWNNETCQCKCKNYRICKKDYSWNPSTCICENGKYLKSIADD